MILFLSCFFGSFLGVIGANVINLSFINKLVDNNFEDRWLE